METIRILIADDQPGVVAAMQQYLAAQPGMRVLGPVPSFAAAADWIAHDPVDVVIFGLQGMGDGPISGVYRLRRAAPQTRLIVCSANIHAASDLLKEAIHYP